MNGLLHMAREIAYLASGAVLALLASNPGPYRARAIQALARRAGGVALVEICQDGSSTVHVKGEDMNFKIAL
jgi:TusA-related sulfurtransferase